MRYDRNKVETGSTYGLILGRVSVSGSPAQWVAEAQGKSHTPEILSPKPLTGRIRVSFTYWSRRKDSEPMFCPRRRGPSVVIRYTKCTRPHVLICTIAL